MGDLNRARRRAEEFARLLEDGAHHSPGDPELDEALELVGQLRSAGGVQPSAEFSASLRQQLVDQAAARITATPAEPDDTEDDDGDGSVTPLRTTSRQRGRWIAGVAAFAALAGGIGTAAAAQESVPGDALYGLKRSLEAVASKVSVTDDSRGRRELSHALVRLSEVEELVGKGGPSTEITNTLHDFTSESRSGGDHLLAAFQADNDASSIDRIYTFGGEARVRLTGLASTVPDSSRAALAEAIATVDQLTQRAHTACPACDSPKVMTTIAPSTANPTDSGRPGDTQQPTAVPSDGSTLATSKPPRNTLGTPSVPLPTGQPTRGGTPLPTSTPTLIPTALPTILPTSTSTVSGTPTLIPTITLSLPPILQWLLPTPS